VNEKGNITDEELFASQAFGAYLADLAENASKRYKKPICVGLISARFLTGISLSIHRIAVGHAPITLWMITIPSNVIKKIGNPRKVVVWYDDLSKAKKPPAWMKEILFSDDVPGNEKVNQDHHFKWWFDSGPL